MIPSVIGRIGEVFDIELWLQWFGELDRTFIFLLTLPFVVALVGLWAAYRDRKREEAHAPGQASGPLPEREKGAGDNRDAWRGPAVRE
jgi:hypothetical protein